ncbi:phosphatase domain-containing protein [Lacunimicrobium album]
MASDRLILFPTVGTLSPDGKFYLLDVHGWIYDPTRQTKLGRAVISVLRQKLNLIDEGSVTELFRARSGFFAVYPGKRKAMLLKVGTFYQVSSKANRLGQFKDILKIPREIVDGQLDGRDSGVVRIEASLHTLDHIEQEKLPTTTGECFILKDSGMSLVTDIDDTIKHSIVRNKQELLINSFLNPFREIEGMSALYRDLSSAITSFHYVSASPWQMFAPLAEFLATEGFPVGSIHLRKFGLKDVTFLKKFSPSYKQKRKIIDALIVRFPHRRFIMIGDSGEHDSEMYASLCVKYKTRISKVFIRNVAGADNSLRRFQKAFAGVPESVWGTFDDADQLRERLVDYLEPLPSGTAGQTVPFTSATG